MLSIKKLSADKWNYYLNIDRELGESNHFRGSLLKFFNFNADNIETDLKCAFARTNPFSGQRLIYSNNSTIAAFDLTFSAPKELSLLGLAHPDSEVRKAALACHNTSVTKCFDFIEIVASNFRKAEAKTVRCLESNGLLALESRHFLSRTNDPHVHSHLVIFNLTTPDFNMWRTINSSILYANAKELSTLYSDHLSASFNEAFTATKTSHKALYDINRDIIDLFSKRSIQIKNELNKSAISPSLRARELAAIKTRPTKQVGRSLEDLQKLWDQEASISVITKSAVNLGQPKKHEIEINQKELIALAIERFKGLTKDHSLEL